MRLALMAGLYWFVKHERILSGASPQTRPYSWKTLYLCLKDIQFCKSITFLCNLLLFK